ncbi:MAG: hypothetical protein ACO1NY_10255 [Pseudorhodoplanes sp.]
MTSITSSAMFQRISPRDMLQNELLSEVSSGKISTEDQDALSAALDTIDAAMQGSRPAGGGKPPSPDEMKAKIDGLIQEQVDSGALTAAQAEELKEVFANAMPPGGPGGPGGPGRPGGATGDEASIAGATDNSGATTDVADLISDFVKLLQESKGSKGYGDSGDALLSDISALLVDYKT